MDDRAAVAFSLHGLPIGGGVAIGRALVLQQHGQDVARYRLADEAAVADERRRLSEAFDVVRAELAELATELPLAAPAEARALLEVHALILDDPMLADAADAMVLGERWNAEWALWTRAGALSEQFEMLDDDYLRERSRDVRQVVDRVLKVLTGNTRRTPSHADMSAAEPTIVVADDISPADLLHWRAADAFCIDLGGATSHTAILARSFGRPAVIGLGTAREAVREGDLVIVDGDTGTLIVSPDAAALALYRERQRASAAATADLRRLVGVRARTRDGVDIALHANVELPAEAALARDAGAEGIGLMRSEFLFLGRDEPPDEDEQFEAYAEAVRLMDGRPVTIRTVDVGADKALPHDALPQQLASANPALGRRAIRLCLAEPAFFLTQLRAILRASACGPVRLLLPLLSSAEEVHASLRLIAQARRQLADAGMPMAGHLPVGGMIEVPAAAIMASWFARRLDFLSIGTNDLIQYTLAIDRTDDTVAAMYDPMHPAVLRLIAGTIGAADRAGIPVSVCGEMAGDPAFAPLLIGLGLREFSMDASQLLRVKDVVLRTDAQQARQEAPRALRGFATRPRQAAAR